MSCSCSNSPCSCSPCQPANTVYQGTCTDPGSATTLRHVLGLDSSFCQRRLLPGDGGYLVARATGSGGWLIDFTTEPVIPLSNITAVQSQTFGQFIVQGSDDIMRTLTGPAVENLYPRTNAAGQITFETLPTATVPDPLVVNDLTVVTNAQIADLQITGTATATGLATGTLTNVLGLNTSNEIIKGTIADTGSQCAAFFENTVSPNPQNSYPNANSSPGNPLVIGNILFDSTWPNGVPGAGGLFAVLDQYTLSCVTPGTYVVDFFGMTRENTNQGGSGSQVISLKVNGIIVNSGNSNNWLNQNNQENLAHLAGQDMRRYIQGQTIQLVLGSGATANTKCYEVRCNVTRLGA